MTGEMIDNALKDLSKEAKDVYGNKLKEIILFGSCARGDYESDSDVDIMILLDVQAESVPQEMSRISPVIHNLDHKYEYELLFAPIVQSYDMFNYWLDVTPFYQAVRNEGVRYA